MVDRDEPLFERGAEAESKEDPGDFDLPSRIRRLFSQQPYAAQLLQNGDVVTVDGNLGIVTVGPPEFDLELGSSRSA